MPSASPPSHPDVPPFPSPSTFSILPDIYLLIARLNILQTGGGQQTSQNPPSSSQSQSQPQTQAQTQPTSQPSAASTSTTPTPHLHTGPPLDLKDLPAQVYPIKQRLAKARAAVSALPDVERSVEEQEAEIRELERTVALLKRRLGKLGEIATGKQEEGDVVMGGTKGEISHLKNRSTKEQ
ncbi:uncharacterized protein Z518_09767 [Rhinocladiella mackenziei CBS 650.93]|uniref:Mediator of RNA polymerase II transcription subunit 9 n=1 Tax=Rhinocladiella mackenziei CBS 650.93 TaxID=1442369 RepID=A0A0D2FFB2_9EURO|nr:uncharacterized protein Z518_09767 [Rhinocladiella mackenziei CBS 650.93]KIX00702.1 hypothetical protein Z518_09767 [Rhinocladiella mackenziei CBS 650.93]